MNRVRDYFQNLINDSRFSFIYEHIIKPFLGTAFLSIFFFIIIYYKNEECSFKDSFFYIYCFFIPLAVNLAVSFLDLSKQKKGAVYGMSVVAVPFLAIITAQLFSKYSFYPAFYREFQASGSFYLLYIMQSVFFVIGGMFLGLIDEFIFSYENPAELKYLSGGSGSGGSQLSKSKRRKLKKKKRSSQKLDEQKNAVLDEIIKGDESDDAEDETDNEPTAESDSDDTADENNEEADEDKSKNINDPKK